MNGAVEAANKNIKKIVGKMTETYRDRSMECFIFFVIENNGLKYLLIFYKKYFIEGLSYYSTNKN